MIPFLPKENNELPDNYGAKFFYLSGGVDEFVLASHRLDPSNKILELLTADDLHMWVMLENVNRIEFNKNFSKIISLKEKMNNETTPISQ